MEKVTLTKNAPHRVVACPGRHFSRRRDAAAATTAVVAVGRKSSLSPKIERAHLRKSRAVHPPTGKTRTKIGFRSSNVSRRGATRLFVIAPRRVPGPNKVYLAGMQSRAISFADIRNRMLLSDIPSPQFRRIRRRGTLTDVKKKKIQGEERPSNSRSRLLADRNVWKRIYPKHLVAKVGSKTQTRAKSQ